MAASGKRRFQEVAASFPTNFAAILRSCPAPLMRENEEAVTNRVQDKQQNKVEVFLRICPTTPPSTTTTTTAETTTATNILDTNDTNVHLHEPPHVNAAATTTTNRKHTKTFNFNAVFDQDSSMMEICSRTLDRILGSVISGSDACLFSYGHARLGKTYTMLGVDDRPDLLGIIPCSIAWLFRMLDDLKKNSGIRYSIRVSALEVTGKQEEVKDLLSESFASAETPHSTTCSDPLDVMGGYRAPTPEHAALFLDAAIATRTISTDDAERRNSHFLYTLHVHQQRFDGSHETTSTHSRLHLLDLGSCQKHKDSGTSMSLSELGNIFFSLLNGKKFIPQCDSKLTQLLKKIFSPSPNIEACMVAHVSPTIKSYHQTLQVLHLASQIQRSTSKRRSRNSSSNGISPSESIESSTRNSDFDYSSSSEQSVDTVIFVAKKPPDHKPSDPAPPPNKTIPPRAKIYPKNLSNLKKSIHSHSGDAEQQQAKVHKNVKEIKSSPIIERCQPQGREVSHHYHESSIATSMDDEKRIESEQMSENNRSTFKESNSELWIDGPGKGAMISEQWIDGPHEFWTTPCAGIHGLKSPKIKKLYTALKQKHQQLHLESCQKSTRCNATTNDTEVDKQEKQQQQSQSLHTLQDEKYFVTASPDITAFHNFFEKHKQDLIHQKFSLPTESRLNNFEDFLPDNCCCKCHMKNGDCKTAQSKSPKQTNQAKENKHPKLKVDRSQTELNEFIQDDRIADWVSSVQESGFSKFTQLLHSRKELLKSFQSPKNRHNMKPVLIEYFQNASPLATFDSPLVPPECNSPPPDYDSCMANNHLDINENQMSSQNSQTLLQTDVAEETRVKDEIHVRKRTSTKPQVLVSNSKLCNGSAVTKTFPDPARKLGPDGASCHSLDGESSTLDHCSIHESLRRDRSKKTNMSGGNNLKSSRNFSSSETIFVPSFENDLLSPNALIHMQSSSKNLTSPKKERCSLAMALLSCAAKYRKKTESVQSKSKPHPATSAFCLRQLSGRMDNSDASDLEFQEQKNNTKRNLLVIHNMECSGTKSYKSIVQPPSSLKVNAPSRAPR